MSGGGRLRVLGIDPGTAVTGWGIVERSRGAFAYVAHGTVRTRAGAPLPTKLAAIHAALETCCAEWSPTVVALETPFVGRNVQSALRLGEVRGVAMLVAAAAGCEVAQYSPAAVKMAVTGNGRAEKPQVQRMIAREFALAAELPPDAADALAVALSHLQSAGFREALVARPAPRAKVAPKKVVREDVVRVKVG